MILTFDCYGTLIDWESGISDACIQAAAEGGVTLDRETVLRIHAEVEPQIQSAGFKPYRDVLCQVALGIAIRAGWDLAEDYASFLPDSLPSWKPFPDTNAALEQLCEQGLRLGILSNVDNDLLEGTLRHFVVPFAFLVTAQDLGSYKPALAHFERAKEIAGGEEWVHVAQSYFHDVEPAVASGVPVVWINRKGQSTGGDARPNAEYATLGEFAHALSMGAEF
jgi:2-haloalkanoic acid dehalogenase type II